MSGFQTMFSDVLKWKVLQDADLFNDFVSKHRLSRDEQMVLYKTAKMIHTYKQTKNLSDLDVGLFDKTLHIKNTYKKLIEEDSFEDTFQKNIINKVDEVIEEDIKESEKTPSKFDYKNYIYIFIFIASMIKLTYTYFTTDELKCDLIDASTCTKLGYLYANGYVKQDYFKAKELYKKGCDGGDALGCNNLGYLYNTGKVIKQNYFKAKEFYKKACDGGNATGCKNLGYLYRKGHGEKQNYQKAKEYYEKACKLGLSSACGK